MKRRQRAARVALLTLMVSVAAFAANETRKEYRFTVGPQASVTINNQFGPISVKPGAGAATSHIRSLPRCFATTGGVSGCPVVRLWFVTSNVSAFSAIACGAMISAIVAIEAAIRANGLLAMLTSLSCPCEPNQERLRFP